VLRLPSFFFLRCLCTLSQIISEYVCSVFSIREKSKNCCLPVTKVTSKHPFPAGIVRFTQYDTMRFRCSVDKLSSSSRIAKVMPSQRPRGDSNPRPSDPKSDALIHCATRPTTQEISLSCTYALQFPKACIDSSQAASFY
jgi:hypothetical protein